MRGRSFELIAYLSGVDPEKKWELEEYREKRTLTQNAYYWQLLAKVAAVQRISTNRLHNTLLRDCGYPVIISNKIVFLTLPDTDEAEEKAIESSTYHIKPTAKTSTGQNGTTFRIYMMLRGSSEMNTTEFSHLVDLLVQEAQQNDIETLPRQELDRLREMAERKENAKG